MDQFLPLNIFETKKCFFQFWSKSGIWVMVRFLNSNAPGLQKCLQNRPINDPKPPILKRWGLSIVIWEEVKLWNASKQRFWSKKKRLLPKFEVSWTKMRKNYLKNLIAERSFSHCLNEINKTIFWCLCVQVAKPIEKTFQSTFLW